MESNIKQDKIILDLKLAKEISKVLHNHWFSEINSEYNNEDVINVSISLDEEISKNSETSRSRE